jgi:hypothetical protein
MSQGCHEPGCNAWKPLRPAMGSRVGPCSMTLPSAGRQSRPKTRRESLASFAQKKRR